MNDFDITEFSNLDESKKNTLRGLIEEAKTTVDMRALRKLANIAFVVATDSTANIDVLLSSKKDFRELGTSVKDAEAGVHVLRTWFAHQLQRIRRSQIGYRSDAAKQFDNEGIVILNSFFPENLVTRLEREIEKVDYSVNKQLGNIISGMPDTNAALREAAFGRSHGGVSNLKSNVFDCLAMSVTHQEARICYANNTFVQRLHNKKGDGDIQKVLHQDTFFPCLKFWYFPKEVSLKDGPLTYVPGSHVLSYERLKHIYEQSIACAKGQVEPERTRSHIEGSLRVFDKELKKMKLKPKAYAVPRNTLVIANVFGLHRRSEVEVEGFRDSIHGSIRISTPFGE